MYFGLRNRLLTNDCFSYRSCEMSADREQAATPTMESMELNCDVFNESVTSGYDGDKEDEGESFFDIDGRYCFWPKLLCILSCLK